MKLTSNSYVETAYAGANVGYIMTTDGIVMIDTPQRPTDAVEWRREIESKGQVKYIINTEPHFDHFTGNYFFSAPVIAHEQAREKMVASDPSVAIARIAEIDPNGLSLINDYFVNGPSISFSDRLTLYLGNHTIHIIHLPGHTLGQVGVFVPEERVVFTGDNVFYKTFSYFHDANPFAWLESLEKVDELDVDFIVPGHGDVCDKSYLGVQASCIESTLESVRKAIGLGWSKQETGDRVTPVDTYLMLPGIGPELYKRGLAHLYELLIDR
ncbi:MBL fold metallo-hydrolase [Chloroflexota bacterium]